MPFLLGAFGPVVQKSQEKKLALIAAQQAKGDNLQTITFAEGVIYAGYKHDECSVTDKVMPLLGNQGVFVGRLFDRQTYIPVTFNDVDVDDLLQNPKLIVQKWWGCYSGLLYDTTKRQCMLLRDPQGLSTLSYIITSESIIFSTELALLYDALETKPSLNLAYFAEYVINKNQLSLLTPFQDVHELAPGMGLYRAPDGSCSLEYLWDLASYSGSFIADEKAFEEELLATLKSSVRAWASESSGICLELSGGTDSSAMMILLRDMLPTANIIGVNYFDSKTPSSNEIEHAQEVAQICNTPLHCIDWQNSSILDPLPTSWRPDKPTTFALFYNTCQQLRELAMRYNCSDIMNGQGGDHVFLAPPLNEALADYWLDKGFKGISSPLKELSSSSRTPWRKLIRDTVKDVACYYLKQEQPLPQAEFEFLTQLINTSLKRMNFFESTAQEFLSW